MNKTMLVMNQEIRATLRRKTFLLFGFGIPLGLGIVALIFMFVNREVSSPGLSQAQAEVAIGSESTQEGYIDEGDFIRFLPPNIPENWLVEYPNEAAAISALTEKKIDAYYIIPADYVDSGEITYVKPVYNPIADHVNSDGIKWVLLANLLGDAEVAAEVVNPLVVTTVSLAPEGEDERQDSWISELLPNLMAIMLYLIIIMSASILVAAVTDEKKNRVLEVLLSSISTRQFIAGKILAVGILGLLMVATWIAILWAVASFGGQPLNIPNDFNLPPALLIWACIYGLLGYAIYGAQMAGLGALVPDIKDSRGLSFIVLLPLIVVYLFLIAIVENPNGLVAVIASLFPLTSPVGMITRMASMEVPLWQGILAAFLQLAAAFFIVRMTARLFRAQIMLSGQAVNVKSYFHALLGKS